MVKFDTWPMGTKIQKTYRYNIEQNMLPNILWSEIVVMMIGLGMAEVEIIVI